jgi:hypothetical protein
LIQAVADLRDTVEEITNPVVVQGVILDLELPEDALLVAAMADAGLEQGLTATVFVGDTRALDELDQTSSGARVTVEGVRAAEVEAGVFSLWPEDGLSYQQGAQWTLKVRQPSEGDRGEVSIRLPDPAPVYVPEMHAPGTSMTLDFDGLGYETVLAYVLNAKGETTWTNQPESILEVFELTLSNTTVQTLEIPASAFPDASIYAVALAGMVHSDNTDFDGVNTLLSNMMAGRMRLHPVFTSPSLTAVGRILDIPKPDDPVLIDAFDRAGLPSGTTASFFLADALTDASSLEEAGLEGADLSLVAENLAFDPVDEGDGIYTLLPGEGPPWDTGATWDLDISYDGRQAELEVRLPGRPELGLPGKHLASQPLLIDITEQGFDAASVTIVNESGQVVYTTEPETSDALAQAIDDTDALELIIVPGEVLDQPGLYGVAVAAFVEGATEQFTGVNTELSTLLAGRMAVATLRVVL